MDIVCRQCHYKISEEEISEHYWGEMLKLAAASIELAVNIFLCFRTKIDEDANLKYQNKLLGRANQYEIRCPECFQYNGWIKIARELEKINEDEKTK